MYAADFRGTARRALAGNWGVAIGLTLVAALLGGGSLAGGSSAGANVSLNESLYAFWLAPLLAILFAYLLVVVLLGGAVDLGLKLYYVRLLRGEEQRPFTTLFERFHIFGKALGLRLVMGLFIFLWSLLLVVPGVIAEYRYAMAPYLMAENPDLGILDAIRQSGEMMNGYKGRLFCLRLSFFGWNLLAALACGLGFIVLDPYRYAAEASFYLYRGGMDNAAA